MVARLKGTGGEDAALDVAQAAVALGITPQAVRKRVRRGSLHAYKVEGEWRIVLPMGRDAAQATAYPAGRATGRDAGWDTAQDAGHPGGEDAARADQAELVATLRDEVAFLRRELETRTEELRRRDHIIAALASRPLLPVGVAVPTPDAAPPHEVRPDSKRLGFWRRLWGG